MKRYVKASQNLIEVSEKDLFDAGYEPDDLAYAQDYDSSLEHIAWMESEDFGIIEKVRDLDNNDILYVQVYGRGRISVLDI